MRQYSAGRRPRAHDLAWREMLARSYISAPRQGLALADSHDQASVICAELDVVMKITKHFFMIIQQGNGFVKPRRQIQVL